MTERSDQAIGHGRAAVVTRRHDGSDDIARKLFVGSPAADLANGICYGAPCDYRWCEPAIRAAHYRRCALGPLVSFWFGHRLTVARSKAWGFDRARRAHYLDTLWVDGEPLPLCSPFHHVSKGELIRLKKTVMEPLQERLVEAGFVGTTWQAGKGQPCALSNFLRQGEAAQDDAPWAWMNLESGVPAMASYQPRHLFGFYLPQALKRGRILFDDLDIPTLESFVAAHEGPLREHMGEDGYTQFLDNIEHLVSAHQAWSHETRVSRSLGYYLALERISPAQGDFYRARPWRWLLRLPFLVTTELSRTVARKLREWWPLYRGYLNPFRWLRFFFRITFLRSYRLETSRKFTRLGIARWVEFGRIDHEQAAQLESELHIRDVNQYMADFGVHLAIKPLGYVLRFTLIPFLWHQGFLAAAAAGFAFMFCGVILRTTYTLFRCVEDLVFLRPPALTALLISPIPSIGTLAYACQMLHSARRGLLAAQFIIYDSLSNLATHLPIWGGRDSEWEHRLNRFAHGLIHLAARDKAIP